MTRFFHAMGSGLDDHRPWTITAMVCTIVLLLTGHALLYSATSVSDATAFGTPWRTVTIHFLQSLAGLVLLTALFLMPLSKLRRLVPYLLLAAVAASLLLFLPFTGVKSGGAVRHVALGFLRWEPGQVLAVTLILWSALVFSRRPLGSRRRMISLFIVGLALVIAILQPDFSLVALILVPIAGQSLVAGLRLPRAARLALGMGVLILILAALHPYITRRVDGWRHTQATLYDAGYDYVLLQRGVSSGGAWGKGLGQGEHIRKTGVAKSDYLVAHAFEELGVFRALLLLALYLPIFLLGLRAARIHRRSFLGLTGVGMAGYILTAATIHTAVSLRIIPVTAIHMPFLSYGGSSLIMSMAALGLLISVNRVPAGKGPEDTASERVAEEAGPV